MLKVFEGTFPVMESFGGRTYLEEASLGTFEIHTCYLLLFLPSLLLGYHETGGLCHMLTLLYMFCLNRGPESTEPTTTDQRLQNHRSK